MMPLRTALVDSFSRIVEEFACTPMCHRCLIVCALRSVHERPQDNKRNKAVQPGGYKGITSYLNILYISRRTIVFCTRTQIHLFNSRPCWFGYLSLSGASPLPNRYV